MHGSVQFMQIISRYFQRADARSAWSTPAENMGTAPRPGRPAAGAKLRAEPIRTPGVGVWSAEPGGSDRARVPAALGPVTKITSPHRSHFPHRFFSRLKISTVELRGDISMALLFHVIPPFFIWIFPLRGLSSFRRAFSFAEPFFLRSSGVDTGHGHGPWLASVLRGKKG